MTNIIVHDNFGDELDIIAITMNITGRYGLSGVWKRSMNKYFLSWEGLVYPQVSESTHN